MSKLEELINELCPNGVEYKTLKDIFIQYSGMTGVSNKWKEDGNCQFIDYMNVYKNLKVNTNLLPFATVKSQKQNIINKGDLLLTSASETPDECALSAVVEDEIQENVFMDDHLFGLKLKEEYVRKINTSFINYYMHTNKFRKQVNKAVRGVTRFYISNDAFMKIKVAVPPLEVQCEIVHILDDFTLLSAELSAELKARQKQYEYYKEKLLTDIKDAELITLRDITKLITKGTTPPKFEKEGITFIKTEAFDGSNINKNKLSYISEEIHNTKLKRSILEENDILFTIAGATIGKMTIVTKDLLPANTNQALAIIRLNDNININYIKHIFQSGFMKQYIGKCVKGSAQPNLNLQQLNDFCFPFPSDKKQNEIVLILDKLDSLCNDLSEGLPAEIEARQKQYEYYRDKLLTFKELEVNE